MLSRFAKSFLAIILALVIVTSLAFLHAPFRTFPDPWTGDVLGEGGVAEEVHILPVSAAANAKGNVIMSKLGNATAKAELGKATWKLLHTMTLRFPETPTQDERDALSSFLYLTSRLYPCGECAAEFQQLLAKFPPQTSSRRSAALWLCHVHNQVNERLGKPEFDCTNLDATYDCGCGDEPIGVGSTTTASADAVDLERDPSVDDVTGVGLIKGGAK